MSDRSLWGEDDPTPAKKTSPLRVIMWVLVGLLPAVIIHVFDIPIGASNDVQWALKIALIVICETSIIFFLLPPLATSRTARIIGMFTAFLALGVLLAALIYLAMAFLIPYSTVGERLILPVLVGIFCAILAIFSPVMPIWPINVPDNELGVLVDRNDHFIAYLKPGVRMVRPVDGYERYTQAGPVIVSIDDTSYVSQDNFPFRVRINVVCVFSPINADESMWISLRSVSRDVLANNLETEIIYIARHNIRNYPREELEDYQILTNVMQSIAMDIKEAIASRQHMGIRPLPSNSINVIIDPPEMLADSLQRRVSIESMLLENSEHLNIAIGNDGQIVYGLQAETGGSNKLEQMVLGLVGLIADASQKRQPDQIDAVSSSISVDGEQKTVPDRLPQAGVAPVGEEPDRQLPPDLPEAKPNTLPIDTIQKGSSEPEVIDTEINEKGVYIPRNPILDADDDSLSDIK